LHTIIFLGISLADWGQILSILLLVGGMVKYIVIEPITGRMDRMAEDAKARSEVDRSEHADFRKSINDLGKQVNQHTADIEVLKAEVKK